MQQLLLSQSALEILAENHADCLKRVKSDAKVELLSKFDYHQDQFAGTLWETGRDLSIAAAFGALWAPSRYIWAFVCAIFWTIDRLAYFVTAVP